MVGGRIVYSGDCEAEPSPHTATVGAARAELLFLRTWCILWGPQVVCTGIEPLPNPATTVEKQTTKMYNKISFTKSNKNSEVNYIAEVYDTFIALLFVELLTYREIPEGYCDSSSEWSIQYFGWKI
jgi:hypothetical protein